MAFQHSSFSIDFQRKTRDRTHTNVQKPSTSNARERGEREKHKICASNG